MKYFILWNGQAEQGAVQVDHEVQLMPAPEGAEWIVIDHDIRTHTLAMIDGELQAVERQLPDFVVIGLKRGEVKNAAKAAHAIKRDGGCDSPLGKVQTDPASLATIDNFTVRALAAKAIGEVWSVDFTMSDNSVVEHNADAMISLQAAVHQHITSVHAAWLATKSEIEAAISVAELEAIALA